MAGFAFGRARESTLRVSERELMSRDGAISRGPYSAGAISSIAFARRSAMVDGNVTRVLSRLIALHAPATAKVTTDYIWALAGLLVPDNGDTVKAGLVNKPGSWNQALMELGATVCSPKNPKCQDCPLEFACLAKAEVGSRAKSEGKGKVRLRRTTSHRSRCYE